MRKNTEDNIVKGWNLKFHPFTMFEAAFLSEMTIHKSINILLSLIINTVKYGRIFAILGVQLL